MAIFLIVEKQGGKQYTPSTNKYYGYQQNQRDHNDKKCRSELQEQKEIGIKTYNDRYQLEFSENRQIATKEMIKL